MKAQVEFLFDSSNYIEFGDNENERTNKTKRKLRKVNIKQSKTKKEQICFHLKLE